jgi:hypothetical protein
MSEIEGRGYILASTVSFLREKAGSDAEVVLAGLSSELKQVLGAVQPAGLYPIRLFGELNQAIVDHLARDDEAKARQVLLDCGRHMGREASNTFLKLLMKVLTPKLIAKKLPDFWKRDFTGGHIEVELGASHLDFKILGMDAHNHLCPVSAGWTGFNLELMGQKISEIQIHNWSLSEPAQDGSWFRLSWD